ncbi:uncharacterized protein LOC144021455 isoform X2 [Festucalex cinctus]
MGYDKKQDTTAARHRGIKQRPKKKKKKKIEAAQSLLKLSSEGKVCDDDTDQIVEDLPPEEPASEECHLRHRVDPDEPSPDILKKMQDEIQRLTNENMLLKEQLQTTQIRPESFQGDDDKVRFYCGLPSFAVMMTTFDLVADFIAERGSPPLSKFQEFVLTLMKLRMNTPTEDLAFRFNIPQSAASATFRRVVNVMYRKLRSFILWPEREVLQETMPLDFRKSFDAKVVVLLDYFEIFVDRTTNFTARAQTRTNSKHHKTLKYLIGVAPQGTITFISNGWDGRTSFKYITENCGILDNLLPNDIVLAERGLDGEERVGLKAARLRIPACTKGKKKFSPLEVAESRQIAHVRIHVEHVIGNVRNKYRIVNGPIPIDCLKNDDDDDDDCPFIDKIVTTCCALTNFC